MKYRVSISQRARRQLKKLDRSSALFITAWLRKNLEGTTNPRLHGKPLVGNLKGAWRYLIGNYRVLAEILDDELVIEVIEVGHRGKIYELHK